MALDIKLKDLQLEDGARLADYIEGKKNGDGARYGRTDLNTVAIIGFAPSSLKVAIDTVTTNPNWTPENRHFIWGLNELYLVHPSLDTHWDEWFDIHDPRSSISTRDAKNYEWLAKQTKPIWMTQHFADVPGSCEYPLDRIIKYFGFRYLTNTIAMMILLAAMRGRQEEDAYVDGKFIAKGTVVDPSQAFGEIHIYGVDMAQDSEYAHQRPSCEAAIGFAAGLGIKVYVPPTSDLLKIPFVYGYEADGDALRKKIDARMGELKQQADMARSQGNQAKQNMVAMLAICNEFAAIINKADSEGNGETPYVQAMKARYAELQPEIQKAQVAAEQLLQRAAMLDGAHDDAAYWRRSWSGA